MAGIGNPFANSCILVAVGVVAILINSAIITSVGRRRVFLVTGLFICGLAQLLTAVVYTVNPGTTETGTPVETGRAIVGLAVLYIISYNVSLVRWFSSQIEQLLKLMIA
jgi:SP family sugar:H+ symporter-like MFS transporter